jgi:hypothetical protein
MTLSSRLTFFYKFIFPAFWIVFVGVFTITVSLSQGSPTEMKLFPPTIWILGLVVLWVLAMEFPLRSVRVEGTHLHISNYLREIVVPVASVTKVTENRWVNIHPVTIYFLSETDFGKSIVFMPKVKLMLFWGSHPVVRQIEQMADAARATGKVA